MKFHKSELAGMLYRASDLPETSSVTPSALSPQYVRACCATLWQRVPSATLPKKEARSKMLKLLEWLAQKHGWALTENASQEYSLQGARVAGRVHAALQHNGRTVVVELCFELQEAVLLKLWAAHGQGKQVLLLWAGPALHDTAFVSRLTAILKGRDGDWLHFIQLNKP